jgi:MFS family permease
MSAPSVRRIGSDAKLLRFLAGRFLGLLGDQFLLFAVPLLVYQTTGSVAHSGLVFFIEWTPRILSLPLAGVFADRFGGRRIYLISDAARAMACLVAFFALRSYPDETFRIVALIIGFVAFFNSQAFVALESTLPRLMPLGEVAKAQAVLQSADQTSIILGPAAAALCASLFSKQALFLIVGVAFALSFLNLLVMRGLELGGGVAGQLGGPRRSLVDDFRTGVNTLLSHHQLFPVIALTWLANLMIGTMMSTNAAITTGVFSHSDRVFGMVNTMTGFISVGLLLLVPRLTHRFSITFLGLAAFTTMTGGALLAGLSPSYPGFAVGVVGLMGSIGVFNVFLRTERARIIPREHLGKTMGFIVLLNNCSLPLSGLILGAGAAEVLGPQHLLLMIAAVAALPAAWLLPQLVKGKNHANSRSS